MNSSKKEFLIISIGGLITGIIAVLLVIAGNPANMGFCIACFLRDTAGALKLHSASAVQYIRPETIGLVLGSFLLALIRGEFAPKGGSSALTRFVLGFFVMIGCLAFLGCPFRMVLRLSAGDLNALTGMAGFVAGIGIGIFFLERGFSLKRSYKQPLFEGLAFPAIQLLLLTLLITAPAFIAFSQSGPGSKHAPIVLSLAAGLIIGAISQYTRLCMVGGFRDLFLFKDKRLIAGFAAIFIAALIMNLLTGRFNPGFVQIGRLAHSDHIFNYLGMLLCGLGSVLLGGCPLRQLVLAGEGSSDSAITVLGLAAGAAFSHNFGLAGTAAAKAADGTVTDGGVNTAGRIAVVIGICVVFVIAAVNTFRSAQSQTDKLDLH